MSSRITKDHILAEIRRTARENRGQALGIARFERETGIRRADWFGRYWKGWGDAVREAGLAANALQARFGDEEVLGRYVELARELGRVPVSGDLQLKRRSDPSFPSAKVFLRFGSKAELVGRVREFCIARAEWADVASLFAATEDSLATLTRQPTARDEGFVYLIRSGRYYKIGRTNAVGRREYELGIQLPEQVATVHRITTDDPEGIEAYWHRRFAGKRARGEWFRLTGEDVAAFKRRRFQ